MFEVLRLANQLEIACVHTEYELQLLVGKDAFPSRDRLVTKRQKLLCEVVSPMPPGNRVPAKGAGGGDSMDDACQLQSTRVSTGPQEARTMLRRKAPPFPSQVWIVCVR